MDLRELRYFVAVVEERHVGRAAARLRMTQPPLSRALRKLEHELGAQLLARTPRGVEPTPAGTVLHDEARALLARAERLRSRVAEVAGTATLTVGTLADTADQVGTRLVERFRREHPRVDVAVHESDLGDPTAGLRAGTVDVALTRTPFGAAGIGVRRLWTEPVGVVLHADDPLAGRDRIATTELADRTWVRLPDGTDPTWTRYWTGGPDAAGPGVRTIGECVAAVRWNRACALAPVGQPVGPELVVVPVTDRRPSAVVVAWAGRSPAPLVRSFVRIATAESASGDPDP